MRYLSLIAGAALFAAPAALLAAPATPAKPAAPAAGFKMQPGLWETTIEMSMANLPRLRGEHVYRRCITQADIDKDDIIPMTATRADLNCTRKDFKRTGNTVTYTLECSGQAGKTTGEGKLTFTSATAYDGTIHTTGDVRGRRVSNTRTVHAERVGDCGG